MAVWISLSPGRCCKKTRVFWRLRAGLPAKKLATLDQLSYVRFFIHCCSRIPLDSVILMLKEMLSGEMVTNVLLDCLEPPEISTIDRSFQSLFRSHFITAPDDSCEITTLGTFVSALGIDLTLGSLIGLGIQFGVGAEAIEMAAILSFPKTPWIISNALIHEPNDFNGKNCPVLAFAKGALR